MSYNAVRVLIEDTIRSIDDSVRFAHASAKTFNSIGIKEDKRAHLDSMPMSIQLPDEENQAGYSKTFQVSLVFYKLDSMTAAEKVTTGILDEMDLLSDKFIAKLNQFAMDNEEGGEISSQNIEITGIQKNPVIKVTADCCTGFALSFSIITPDVFDYCSLYD